jgi:hypothetical protein
LPDFFNISSPKIRDCLKTSFDKEQGELDKTGFVAVGPSSNPIVPSIKKLFEEVFNYKVSYFENLREIEDYVRKAGTDYGQRNSNGEKQSICMGVIFDEGSSKK